MADNSEKLCSDEHDKHEKVIKEINNNSETVDYNGNDKTDPEILEAIIASLKDAEDAIVEPRPKSSEKFDSEENSSQSDHAFNESKQNVEITKMDLRLEELDDGLDHFSKGAVSGSLKKNLQENQCNSENQDQKVVVKKSIKRKKNDRVIMSAASVKKAKGKQAETENDHEMESESYSDEEDDVELPKGDTDYKPGKQNTVAFTRSRRSNSKKELEVNFECSQCKFTSEILGELKIHQYSNHEDSKAPSYLDMAEAAVAKLGDTSGVSELTISKEVLFDNFDLIKSREEDKTRACQLLNQALEGGVKLGRLKLSRRRNGKERYWVVPKERMKLVLEKWRKFDESVEFVDSTGIIGKMKATKNVKNKIKIKSKVAKNKKTIKPKVTRVKVNPDDKDDSDSDIAILDESLTSITKQRLIRKNLYMTYIPVPKAPVSISSLPSPPPLTSPGSDEDEPHALLTCPICFHSFWYEYQTINHMREKHHDDERVHKFAKKKLQKQGSASVSWPTSSRMEFQEPRNRSAVVSTNDKTELQDANFEHQEPGSASVSVLTKAKMELNEPRNDSISVFVNDKMELQELESTSVPVATTAKMEHQVLARASVLVPTNAKMEHQEPRNVSVSVPSHKM
eukprot:GFUD01031161.1.p1 GENE.GFUD01031161.1~~GFUD01031161.1.p1  ORF type:complete len:625 (+),score=162.61 GFUD01031161.1:41-1915(+)